MSTLITVRGERSFDGEYHAPVLVHEVVDALGGRPLLLDCTIGGGGHAMALLATGSNVIGIDRDPSALHAATKRASGFIASGHFRAIEGGFRIDQIVALQGRLFGGILADLGVSSHQIDQDARGFSFRPGVLLDMRMSGEGDTAATLLNSATIEELTRILHDYGDEPRSRRLAATIVRRRANRPFVLSDDFVGAIREALGAKTGPSDFARLFQAIRIAVNNELTGLERALPLLRDHLMAGGVLAIIAYHSGEDRLVKHAMRDWSVACHCPPRQPMCTCQGIPLGTLLTRKAIVPSAEEAGRNPRARSAKFRMWQKAA